MPRSREGVFPQPEAFFIRHASLLTRFPFFISLYLFSLLACAGFAQTFSGPDSAYLTELLTRSEQLHVADRREWLLLVHYRARLTGGYASEVDDPSFFLASQGKTDPQGELIATIQAFFSSELIGDEQQPAQCAFLARYRWLKETLAFDDQRLPPQPCKQFESWWGALNPASVSLIFPSAYMHNPASLFGHALLRIDQQGQTEQTRLLAYSVNFAAHVTSHDHLSYVVSGIGGGFRGEFSIKPYYELVKTYGDFEDRDIWEYQVRLSEEQLQRLLMHLWELRSHYFDYFFFDENCAYQILALLEVALPDLYFTDTFRLWTVPADTVRFLALSPGLIEKTTYRPATSTRMRNEFAALSSEERQAVRAIVKKGHTEDTLLSSQMPTDRQGAVLDLAIEYLQYQQVKTPVVAEAKKTSLHYLLVQRSALASPTLPTPIEPFVTQPDLGHGSFRTGIGFGQRRGEWFEELHVRAGYHDLLDTDLGYTPGSQIEVAALRLRRYDTSNRVRLEQLLVADMISLAPWNALMPAPSWKLRMSLETMRRKPCRSCYYLNLNGGAGVAGETRLLRKEIFFLLPELTVDLSPAFTESYRVGGGVTLGAIVPLTDRWKFLLSGTYTHFPVGSCSDEVTALFGQSYALSRNWEVRSEFRHRHDEDEFLFRVQAFWG